MQISFSRRQTRQGKQKHPSRALQLLGLLCVGLLVAACSTNTTTRLTDRAVPEPTELLPEADDDVSPTVAAAVEPTPVSAAPEANEETNEVPPADSNGAEDTGTPEAEEPRIRSFQEFLPDPAAIEERYGDDGLWALTDIKYLEPGPRVGLPCGDTEPPDFAGIEAIYSNISGENLLVMVQQGEGVDIWVQGVAEGVECTELGIRQSALTVPGTDQSVVLEMNPAAPAASMAVSGALQDDIFISFVAGAVNADSPVADPNPLVDLTVAMFERINAAE